MVFTAKTRRSAGEADFRVRRKRYPVRRQKHAAAAQKLGEDGVLAVTPYYNKCTQRGLFLYYREIAAACDLPVIAYNVPARTGVNLLPETMARIAELPESPG